MEWKNERVCDVLNLILGAFLFFTPWIFGFAAGAETLNAIISGIIIAVLSIAALAVFMEWELVAGLWVLVSPWLLGFANTTAMDVHVTVGILVVVIAAVELWMMHRPGRLTASR
jgi:uncharacterized membrane protein YqhA